METLDAIKARKSVRAYLDKEVPDSLIEELLEVAACSPSGANTQPWQVAVVRGETKRQLADAYNQAFNSGEKSVQDYQYYPLQWSETLKARRVACGQQLYEALGIERGDRERRLQQWAANYRAFDAPVVLMFFLHKDLETGSFMDTAMFMQTLMIAAVDRGLATCPQAAMAEYPDQARRILELDDDLVVLCGLALGFEDTAAPVNQYRTPRVPPTEFTRWYS